MRNVYMRYPGGRNKALTLSYDDGVEQDARLISLMHEYGVKGTFNLNTGSFSEEGRVFEKGRVHRRMTERACVDLFQNSGMEVAVHALTHPFLEKLPPAQALYEVLEDRKRLETLFSRPIHGMAYPFGTYNDNVLAQLRAAGIYYARTVISTNDFRLPERWLELTATCHHKSAELPALTEKFVAGQPDNAQLFYLWGHSYEFDSDDNWDVIERFLQTVGKKDDIWYATNIEIYNYIAAFNSLDFTLDGTVVSNPSAAAVWFLSGRQTYEIKGGETLKL